MRGPGTMPETKIMDGPLDARCKLIGALLAVVVCVSTPPDRFPAFAAYYLLLLLAVVLSGVSPRLLAWRLLIVLPFVLGSALLIPFLPSGNGNALFHLGGLRVAHSGLMVLWNLLAKSCFGVLCLSLLAETTPFSDLLEAMQRLRVPRFAVMLTGFTHRYAFVLAGEARRMMRARDARGYRGRWLWEAHIAGRMIGVLFLRAFERGERIHLAMISRGFNGALHAEPRSLRPRDRAFLAGSAVLWLLLRVGLA